MLNNIRLSDQEMKDSEMADLKNEHGHYCHQCRRCVPQCIHRLEIPTVMRSYMYAYGFGNMEHAQHTLSEEYCSLIRA